jgi:integrase/recombinase XerC
MKNSPKTLTKREIATLLHSVRKSRQARERTLFMLALATGLRCHELIGLNIQDVLRPDGDIVRSLQLRVFKGTANPQSQIVFFSRKARLALKNWLALRRVKNEPVTSESPLFLSRRGLRLSLRQVRWLFRRCQLLAGFDRRFGFHALRHTACTSLYHATKDIRLTQRFARHASIVTTMIYTHPSDEDLAAAVELIL